MSHVFKNYWLTDAASDIEQTDLILMDLSISDHNINRIKILLTIKIYILAIFGRALMFILHDKCKI